MSKRAIVAALLPIVLFTGACGARSSLRLEDAEDGGISGGPGGGVPCEAGKAVVPAKEADHIEVDGDDIYFTVSDGAGDGLLMRASSSTPTDPVVVLDGLVRPGDFTIADGVIFISDEGRIQRLELDGASAPSTIYAGEEAPAFQIVADEDGLYWVPAPDATTVGRITFQRFGGASSTTLLEGIGGLTGIALLGSTVVFTAVTVPFGNGETNVVASVPKAGGAITVHATQRQQVQCPMDVGGRIGWLETSVALTGPIGVYTMAVDDGAGPSLLLQPPSGESPLVARSRGGVVAMTTYDRVSEGAVYTASLADPERREMDRRDEICAEPAIGDGFVAWSVLPSREDPEAADARWTCR